MPASEPVLLAITAAVLLAAAVRVVAGFRRYRETARAVLEATPDIRVTRSGPAGLAVTVAGFPLTVPLLHRYLTRSLPPLDELVRSLRGHVPPVSIAPLALVRDRLLPMLKRDATLPPAAGYVPENKVLRLPFDGAVVIAYAIEGLFRVTYVTEGMLSAWGLSPEALHQLALTNLRGNTEHLLAEIGGARADYVALDGFDAARLLVADLLIPPDIREPVLAIPHEHALLIRSRSAASMLREETTRALAGSSLPLTDRLYRWSPDGPVAEGPEQPG